MRMRVWLLVVAVGVAVACTVKVRLEAPRDPVRVEVTAPQLPDGGI